MSQQYPIPRTTRGPVELVASNGQTNFTFPFWLTDGRDVEVRVKPVGSTGFGAPLSFGSAYTATNLNVVGGATIVLTVGRVAGDVVRLRGKRVPTRTTSVVQGGTVRSVPLELELDLLNTTQQELSRDVDQAESDVLAQDGRLAAIEPLLADIDQRAVRVRPGEIGVVLPTAAARAGRLAGYDGVGNPVPVDIATVTTSGQADFASTIAAAGATIPVVQTFFRTAGYSAPEDGGGAIWRVVGGEPSHPGKLSLADGKWGEIASLRINSRMLGNNLANAVAAALALGLALDVLPGETAIVNVAGYADFVSRYAGVRDWRMADAAKLRFKFPDGTHNFTAGLTASHPQGSQIEVIGNEANPAACILRATNENDIFYARRGGCWGWINGFRLEKQGTKARIGILCDDRGAIFVGPNVQIDNFYYGVAARTGSFAFCQGVTVTNAGDVGIWAYCGSQINADNSNVSGSADAAQPLGFGIMAEYGSYVSANGATTTGNKRSGIAAYSGSTVRAHGATSNSNLDAGFDALQGGTISAQNAVANSNGTYGYYRRDGTCTINVTGATGAGNTLGFEFEFARFPQRTAIGVRLNGDSTFGYVEASGPANTNLALIANGTGYVQARVAGARVADFVGAGASAVNGLRFRNANTGGVVSVEAAGGDADVPLTLAAQGGSSVRLMSRGVAAFEAFSDASAVNRMMARARASGSSVQLSALGTDADIDFEIVPKGSGVLRLGYSTNGATTPGSFAANARLAVKDLSGTTYYIPAMSTPW